MNQVNEAKDLGATAGDRETGQGFTPGPWKAVGYSPGWWQIEGPEQEQIADVNYSDGLDEPTLYPEEANARLIAAAPSLHEAARFARSVLAANPMELSERMAIEKLDAALALANMPVESAKRPTLDHSTDGQAT